MAEGLARMPRHCYNGEILYVLIFKNRQKKANVPDEKDVRFFRSQCFKNLLDFSIKVFL